MEVTVLLADAAQADPNTGKVNALGLGWKTCTSPLPAFSLVILLDIDWDETNTPHQLTLQLLTADGQPVTADGPFGPQPIEFGAQAEAGRPPGTVRGTPLRLPLAITVSPGLNLDPGRYEWRVSVEGFPDATTSERFECRPQPLAPQ